MNKQIEATLNEFVSYPEKYEMENGEYAADIDTRSLGLLLSGDIPHDTRLEFYADEATAAFIVPAWLIEQMTADRNQQIIDYLSKSRGDGP